MSVEWIYSGRNTRINEEKVRTLWTTDDEIEFVEGIGSWYNKWKEPTTQERIERIKKYIETIPLREEWGEVSWVDVEIAAEKLIEKLEVEK